MSPPRYLLDTALCLHVVRERPAWLLRRAEHVRAGDAALSVLTWGALQHAASRGPRRLAALPLLEELAGLLPILPLPPDAGIAYREVHAALATRRRMAVRHRDAAALPDHDAWLLAHARAARLALITHAGRRLPPVPGVRIVCWESREAPARLAQPRYLRP